MRLRSLSPSGRPWLLLSLVLATLACAEVHENPATDGHDVKITFLHTSDVHSRLFPFRMEVIYTDEQMGLEQENEPFGGFGRLSWLIERERQRSDRVVYLDGGDWFQGAPVFNAFLGEAEVRAMSQLNPDATVIGNHEFDNGLENVTVQLERWSSYPVLGANYLFVPGNRLGDIVKPYVIIQSGGLKIGVIGVANFSSLSSITDVGNSLGIIPINIEQTVQYWIDLLSPTVDMVVALSHAGFSEDEDLIRCTTGIDVLFGGHTHLVLLPPKVAKDATGRDVLIVHSGAFAKYLGKLDVVLREGEVAAHTYDLMTVDKRVPEEPRMVDLLEPYRLKLNQMWDLTSVFAFAPTILTKYGFEGGDSSLGNLVAEAMRAYARVDLGFNNTLGIRANIYPGPITFEDLYNVFPFENTVTTMVMSGRDLEVLFDYNTERSAGRGCNSQLQIAGVEYTMDCNRAPLECLCWYERHECSGAPAFDEMFLAPQKCEGFDEKPLTDVCREACECPPGATRLNECRCPPMARDIVITSCSDPLATDLSNCTREPVRPQQLYEVATNDYIARGGSGFIMLRSNNTQVDTGVPIREAVMERLIRSGRCVERCADEHGRQRVRDCPAMAACIDKVDAYFQPFCDGIDQTSGDPGARPEHCVVPPPGTCKKDAHCYDMAALCPGDTCACCTNPVQCGEGETCVSGRCVRAGMVCNEGHCRVSCVEDADCLQEAVLPDLFRICVDGVCRVPHRQACLDDAECANGTAICLADAPRCLDDSQCDGLFCRMGWCQPERVVCQAQADCPEGVPCVFGSCRPDAQACASDAECGSAACVQGHCQGPCGACAQDRDCPAGLLCAEGFCVPPTGRCLEHRCRAYCQEDAQCAAGDVCVEGLCTPAVCTGTRSPETNCRLDAHHRALERCLEVPCARSEVDGRIKRILPENLEGYHTKQPITDPEDVNPDYLSE